jgi:uncharacterized membrane protein YgcG
MHLSRLPILILLVALLGVPAVADERILDFHSDIQVQPNASLVVHEVIRVSSEGERIRHGIFRDFPTRYTGRLGEHYSVDFKVVDVRRDGVEEPYSQEQLTNGVRIKMGSPSMVLSPGEYTYELTYTATRELGFFPDHDELYWNVTGNGWVFPIDIATATVTLPGPVQSGDLKLTGYTGYKGSRDQNLRFYRVDDSTVRFETTAALGSNQGLTIVVGFPKGVVTEPSRVDLFHWFIAENALSVGGLAGLVIVLIYYLAAWMLLGRGPRPGVIVVSYEPPPAVSPPAMRFLQRMGYDDRVLVSAVVDLAVKKYLTIQQEGSLYRLTRLKAEDGTLPVEERNLLRIFFCSGTEISISAAQAMTITAAKTTLAKDLDLEENPELFHKNGRWAWPGILLTLAAFAAMVMTLQGAPRGGIATMIVWLSAWSVAIVALIRVTARAWRSHNRAGCITVVMAAAFILSELIVLGILAAMIGLRPVLILLALVITNAVGVFSLRALTAAGRKLLDQIEGFKQYLVEVDSDRIRRLNPPEKTPALFEKCLPYALALGVEQAWAKQFAGVLAQAAGAVGGTTTTYSPAWFSSTNWDTFDSNRFAGSFSSDFSSAISSAASPPGSSSGFSNSGGSSGGGGGGGGGGGW